MKNILVIITIILTSFQVKAQIIKEKSIDASIGFGLTSPYDDVDITGTGFYLQGEYVLKLASWVDVRPYAGLILTKPQSDDNQEYGPDYKATTKAFLIGGKTRIKAPIPWVAPYIEFGVGASMGSFETYTPYTNLEDNGLIVHIPFSLGLELGKKHNFDVAFTYYYHPSMQQFAGAFAFGLSIPLSS
ncbi:hypothetical protein OS188_10245 [Xanthomarina sp. F1114]|uniref:hypothetical protein n=1 Tax=Xanthomarina sp. F1114 TaxID=2996019 RepID=UPI00225E2D01|nr:hypothetical protein [Xanthomarina sp. F1114]MCX7548330.1 hypothetical protein [Xanthomarina sp. F1114]